MMETYEEAVRKVFNDFQGRPLFRVMAKGADLSDRP